MSVDLSSRLSSRLLRGIVRALPERQAEWGQAMQAELAAVTDAPERWRFVAGCAAAVVRRPVGIAAVGRLVTRIAAAAAAIGLAWAIDVPRVRLEAIGVVVLLMGFSGLLHSSIGFGRVSGARAVRLVAGGGAVIAAAQAMLTFHQLHADAPLTLPANATIGVYDVKRATVELVVLIVVLSIFLVALAGVTARRSRLSPAAVATGASTAAVASCGWFVVVLLHPSAATVSAPSLLTILGAGLAAVVWGSRSRPGAGVQSALVAGLLAATGTAFAVGTLMDLLSLTSGWVSNSMPPSYATPAPTRIVDTVVVYFPGLVLALVLAIMTIKPARSSARSSAVLRPVAR